MMLNLGAWAPLEVGAGREEHVSSWNSICKDIKAGRSATSSVGGGVGYTRRQWKRAREGRQPSLGAKVECFLLCTLYPEQAHNHNPSISVY